MTKHIFLLLIVVHLITGSNSSAQLLINIPSLGLIQGEVNPLVNNVRQFIGVPFTRLPGGALRFQSPIALLPVANTSSVYDATAAAHQDGFPFFH